MSSLFRRTLSSTPRLARAKTTVVPGAPRRSLSYASFGLAATTLSITAYTVGCIFPPSAALILFPRAAPPPATAGSPEALAQTEALEKELQALPFLQQHRTLPDASEWYETRPYANYPEERRVNSLVAGTLHGAGKLGVKAVVRAKKDESESVVVLHVGRGLCGHDGIVHGGLLATLLDEIMARTAINNLPAKIGVTANLSLNYRAPTMADQFIVIRTFLTEAKGRKSVVSARVETVEGTLLVEANAVFIQPRYAKMLDTGLIKKAMGEPDTTHPAVQLD